MYTDEKHLNHLCTSVAQNFMIIAYFDCFAGIAGDMALGALLDCGVPVDELRQGLSALPVSGWDIEARPVLKSGIHALDVTISLHGVTDADELKVVADSTHGQHHSHDHHNREHHHNHEDHTHDHSHNHGHEGHGTAPHVHGRSMAEIRDIIETSALSDRVKKTSLDIFWSIARVEARMHHSTPEEIHFHEIGGVDSLIDICGVAWCLEYFGVDEVHCSPLPYSSGYVDCAHGRMPVPAPATLELLKGVPMVPTEIRGEMVTPTGAGIMATLGRGFGPPPPLTPRHIGFGAGKKEFADRPNLLRVVIGDAVQNGRVVQPTGAMEVATAQNDGLEWQTMSLVETNIDDMNPEFFAHVFERVFAAGAVDVWLQPAQMKKNRPASLLGALCPQAGREAVITAILRETTTLGVRVSDVQRAALPRDNRTVETGFGTVRVKVAQWPRGDVWRAAPEYDDVARLAAQHNVPAHQVFQAVLSAFAASGSTAGADTTVTEATVAETHASEPAGRGQPL
jgi:uncharacterized protein (TIGR00299 family) protein